MIWSISFSFLVPILFFLALVSKPTSIPVKKSTKFFILPSRINLFNPVNYKKVMIDLDEFKNSFNL